jgi:hypothetical protein
MTSCCRRGMRYKAQASTFYECGTLNIKRKGYLVWKGLQLGSGFDVEITFEKHVGIDGASIGINDEYDLTPTLAKFLAQNHALIHSRMSGIEALLAGYRQFYRQECYKKVDVLSYGFLSRVFDHPRDPEGLAQDAIKHEHDLRVRQLLVCNEEAFRITYERLAAVSTTELATWWYIFWVCVDLHCWPFTLVMFSSGLPRMIFGGETRILSENSDNTLQTLIHTIHHLLHIRPYPAPCWKASSHNGACLIEGQTEGTSSTMDF